MKSIQVNERYAVITGATCGIGRAFARSLAAQGYHLLVTGRRENILKKLAKELSESYQVKVRIVIVDFVYERQLKKLMQAIDDLQAVEVLVNNAGFGCKKKFFEDSFANQEKMLKVHIHATCAITHRVVPKMLANGVGSIINVSSLAAFTPLADNYFYSASKAFLTTFSESLHLELHGKNIRIQALCPGFTITEFHKKLGKEPKPAGNRSILPWMTAKSVVAKSLYALRRHKQVIYVPGILNQMIFRMVRIMPRWFYYCLAKNLSAA